MTKLEKSIRQIIRVNHAGEFGAQKIYNGQIKFIKNKLGWAPNITFDDGVKTTIDWYRKFLKLYQNVAGKYYWEFGN